MGLSARTTGAEGATPILIRNAERRLAIATNADAAAGRPLGLYGNRFAAAPLDVIRHATHQVDPPTLTNLIAMAAPSGGRGDYTEPQIESILATAYTGFSAARQESACEDGSKANVIVHTGFWGCGAFGGNRKLMIALQGIAARAARISRLVIHAGDAAGVHEAQRGLDVAETIALRCAPQCKVSSLVCQVAMLGYQWGTSDGN